MLPRHFYRVEWEIARRFTTPYDRVSRSRNFTAPERAAEQVRALSMWVPSHAELLGVWRTAGTHRNGDLKWEVIDPETLPPLPPHVEDRYSVIADAIPQEDT
jgi:hypothetical protein